MAWGHARNLVAMGILPENVSYDHSSGAKPVNDEESLGELNVYAW
jgi:hypothetical protein